MYQDALSHFKKVDPILYQEAKRLKSFELNKSSDFLNSLCREIIGQQLSGKVAQVIFERFLKLFPKEKIDIKILLNLEEQKLRDCGMAWAKVRALKDLSQKIINKELNLKFLNDQSNETVVLELTKVKGIGPWTAEMFLMFALGREDVFSPADLGLKNSMIKLYKLKKDVSKEKLLKLSSKWKPYRTYASIILWKSLDNFEPPTTQ